ncbi:MAG: GDP-mannose 4,6-dehydratase [Lactobacillales bacterium]|jgi:GDPmannose 4,6-dehydratase|nr:GDP-mannose 4,6-dehydratase [Lactobacillales bacterium]
MSKKTALITGITGQDGYHLSKFLYEEKGYEVFGIIRGQNNPRYEQVKKELPFVKLIEADLMDVSSLYHAIYSVSPDEIYNLGAISFVEYSFKNPILTADVTAKGVINLLEAIRITGFEKKIRYYQASSSEMFGGTSYNRPEKGYNEESLFHPRSPYGVAKLYGHWITKNYRESYDMYAVSGILFNHEGEHRGEEFVTRKISKAVARISLGLQEKIELGDLWPKRDWGYAGDYVKGMWLMLQQDKADDYVLATGETHSIEDFLDLAFAEIGIKDWKPYIVRNEAFTRPAEVDLLLGDPAKAERELGWKREVNFSDLVSLMVQHDLKEQSKLNGIE